jgi:hypothetical protein
MVKLADIFQPYLRECMNEELNNAALNSILTFNHLI